jgi:hypothetical protein
MTYRTALFGLLAAALLVVGYRADVTSGPTATGALKAAEPADGRPKGDRLGKPVPVEVDGKPLEPWGYPDLFVGDFDGDGRQDLLLGDGNKGRLAIYRNVGTKTDARLSAPQWFDDTVPTGRIPKG